MFVSFPLDVQSPLVPPILRTLTSIAKTFTVYFETCCEVGLGFQILQSEFVFSQYLCAIVRVHVVSSHPVKIIPRHWAKVFLCLSFSYFLRLFWIVLFPVFWTSVNTIITLLFLWLYSNSALSLWQLEQVLLFSISCLRTKVISYLFKSCKTFYN